MNKLAKPSPPEVIKGSVNHLNKQLNQFITPFTLDDQLAISIVLTELKRIKEETEHQKHLLEWAARIIDSGMGSNLRYDPRDWFTDYHNIAKGIEV